MPSKNFKRLNDAIKERTKHLDNNDAYTAGFYYSVLQLLAKEYPDVERELGEHAEFLEHAIEQDKMSDLVEEVMRRR